MISHRAGGSRVSKLEEDSRGWPACCSTNMSSELASTSSHFIGRKQLSIGVDLPSPQNVAEKKAMKRRVRGPHVVGRPASVHQQPQLCTYIATVLAALAAQVWSVYTWVSASSSLIVPLLPVLSCQRTVHEAVKMRSGDLESFGLDAAA